MPLLSRPRTRMQKSNAQKGKATESQPEGRYRISASHPHGEHGSAGASRAWRTGPSSKSLLATTILGSPLSPAIRILTHRAPPLLRIVHFSNCMAAPVAPSPADPPYYLLVAQSNALASPANPASLSLSHPVIEYHYADDPPASLVPQASGEHVLVLDYDPARPGPPTVRSLSRDLVVSAVRVTDAPGAAVAGEPTLRNNNMYVIETTTQPADKCARMSTPLPCMA